MCKVLMINGIKKSNVDKTIEFVKLMGKEMTFGNDDGLGYAATNSRGDLFGERWLYNNTAFTKEPEVIPVSESDKRLAETFPMLFDDIKEIKKPFAYSNFGEIDMQSMVAITLHTRYATSGKGLRNCHPFLNNGTSLIHNGIIHNCDEIGMPTSECDSEAILTSYVKNGVNLDMGQVQKVADDLRGYYVAALLSYDNVGNNIMDIIKGNNDRLTLCYIKELEVFVFATDDRDVVNVCNKMGLTIETKRDIKGDMIIRIDANTGKMLGMSKLVAQSRTYYQPTHQVSSKYKGAKVIQGKNVHMNGHNDYTGQQPSLVSMSEEEVHRWMGGWD